MITKKSIHIASLREAWKGKILEAIKTLGECTQAHVAEYLSRCRTGINFQAAWKELRADGSIQQTERKRWNIATDVK